MIMTTKDKLVFISSFIIFMNWGVRLTTIIITSF